jgi:hypothetical protein
MVLHSRCWLAGLTAVCKCNEWAVYAYIKHKRCCLLPLLPNPPECTPYSESAEASQYKQKCQVLSTAHLVLVVANCQGKQHLSRHLQRDAEDPHVFNLGADAVLQLASHNHCKLQAKNGCPAL